MPFQGIKNFLEGMYAISKSTTNKMNAQRIFSKVCAWKGLRWIDNQIGNRFYASKKNFKAIEAEFWSDDLNLKVKAHLCLNLKMLK